MILEYLQPDPDIWDGVAVVVRAAYYATSLGAAGIAAFAVGFGVRLARCEAERTRRLMIVMAALAITLSIGAAFVRVRILSAGGLFDPLIWEAMLRSRIGDALFIRVAGLGLILLAATRLAFGPFVAGVGALMVVGSYAVMGHSTLYSPRQELVAIVVVHLAGLAFWFGSLAPLSWVATRGDASAAALIEDWSRIAMGVVAILVLGGAIGAALLIRRVDLVLGSWYGNAFLAKMALAVVVLAMAARHKFVLSRRMAERQPDAGPALARSIRLEIAIMLLVFYATAELVSVHPVNAGHRIAELWGVLIARS